MARMNNYGDYNMGQRPNWDRMRPSNMGQGCPDITTIEIYSRGAIETVRVNYPNQEYSTFPNPYPNYPRGGPSNYGPNKIEAVKVGDWGANVGSQWDMGPVNKITSMKIYYGDVVDSIEITYWNNGSIRSTPRYGGGGGNPTQIDLKEGEYLSCMRGYIILNYQGLPCISQIIFETNLGKYGPYGRGSGTPFALPVLEGKIVGFFGRAGDYITSIGCYIMPN
ncbi:jacalin-related lectin 19-like [Zingiber officinale]|uniref:jacalin-related lectin 19-like n=1 Tax=Zingiber officinale TaxID=94328 RepID=UPI001C4AB20F|nr:jacalin-related lectin 19-like [Zingiber officinale]